MRKRAKSPKHMRDSGNMKVDDLPQHHLPLSSQHTPNNRQFASPTDVEITGSASR